MKKVYVVTGYDVGGNSGTVIEAVFAQKKAAVAYANDPENRVWNCAFGPPYGHRTAENPGPAFEVEEYDLRQS